jgi:hypothetical protein
MRGSPDDAPRSTAPTRFASRIGCTFRRGVARGGAGLAAPGSLTSGIWYANNFVTLTVGFTVVARDDQWRRRSQI